MTKECRYCGSLDIDNENYCNDCGMHNTFEDDKQIQNEINLIESENAVSNNILQVEICYDEPKQHNIVSDWINNITRCPNCHNTHVLPIDTKKKFSVGKALVGNTVGGLVFGPVGAIVGAGAGIKGKDGKTKFICQDCGKVFEKKI